MSAKDQAMWGFVQTRDLPLELTRLSDSTNQGAAQAYLDQIDMPTDEVLGCSVFDLMDPRERARAREAVGSRRSPYEMYTTRSRVSTWFRLSSA